jgi:hypothetical protein
MTEKFLSISLQNRVLANWSEVVEGIWTRAFNS